ncbi:MAG: hypothetical protein ACW98X_25420 [Promethearchaeota archaeon]
MLKLSLEDEQILFSLLKCFDEKIFDTNIIIRKHASCGITTIFQNNIIGAEVRRKKWK